MKTALKFLCLLALAGLLPLEASAQLRRRIPVKMILKNHDHHQGGHAARHARQRGDWPVKLI
jgi:hypothetical protein